MICRRPSVLCVVCMCKWAIVLQLLCVTGWLVVSNDSRNENDRLELGNKEKEWINRSKSRLA